MWELHDRLSENIDVRSCGTLIDSIQKHGQKQPVLARPPSGRDNFEYELIYGARRLFAAQHLGIDLLIDLREIDNRSALIEMDVENRVRADISAYERGRSYQRFLTSGYFKNQTEMAKALGVSDSQVSRLLRYAELPAAVVGAFSSPNDIREEWAVALAKLCADPETRTRVMNRARTLSAVPGRGSPQTVFDILVNGRGSHSPSPSRSRDVVVKDPRGRPLFRVRFQAKAVHLVLPREAITLPGLRRINEYVARVLVAEAQNAGSAIQTRARYTPAEIVANGASPAEGLKPN
ncbi:MAG TPA: ParB/RepB/Spo0J family partition protein [Gammaproteobacteria bacterium]|nr:ParB/RepB/Spo0J family partition protein [Gammaproteobacteria bacterium]